jgi:putative tricarboxylic transport membrane protein
MTRTVTIRHSDKIGCILLIVLSIVVIFFSQGLPEGRTPGDPGPGFYPQLIAAAIALLATVQLGKQIRAGVEVTHEVSLETAKQVTFVIGFFAAYVLLLPVFGFLLSSFVFLVVLFRYSGETNPAILLGVSLALPLALFYIFVGIFNVPLPENALVPISRLLPPLPLFVEYGGSVALSEFFEGGSVSRFLLEVMTNV